ncbi:hypothetical protein EAH75_08810 [Rhodanobacter glycinis]|uniref:Uncharacterized protein n=1 Tax=Rhodanobacter glycinis TaxID=582702 RepID=A0A502FGL7_9GAMM|nr:hypothetical protein [Rhodanobacter glycinis]TPG11052.1 hypothetical protein EAH88_00380 [Rhodanobacter glycinis]TPG48541.1 hypothetical protein EAH75_08810 [Rhodanobacter glycinis]
MSIVLHIERLVLDEALLGGERTGGVRDALERELTKLLAQSGAVDALRGLGAVAALPPSLLPAATHPQPMLGSRIAAAVQQGLGVPPIRHTAGKEH